MNLLGKIDVSTEAVAMIIKDLEGNPLSDNEVEQPSISLYGIDSETFRNAVRDSSEDDEGRNEKLLASCVASWENIKTDEGLPIECTYENAIKLFKRYPILSAQADSFIAKRANYLKAVMGN